MRALLAGMEYALKAGVTDLAVYGDSSLVIGHVSGRSKVKAMHLRSLCARVQDLGDRFERVQFGWIPRASNTEADRLATSVLNGDNQFVAATSRPRSARAIIRGSRQECLFAIAATLEDLAQQAREAAR